MILYKPIFLLSNIYILLSSFLAQQCYYWLKSNIHIEKIPIKITDIMLLTLTYYTSCPWSSWPNALFFMNSYFFKKCVQIWINFWYQYFLECWCMIKFVCTELNLLTICHLCHGNRETRLHRFDRQYVKVFQGRNKNVMKMFNGIWKMFDES